MKKIKKKLADKYNLTLWLDSFFVLCNFFISSEFLLNKTVKLGLFSNSFIYLNGVMILIYSVRIRTYLPLHFS